MHPDYEEMREMRESGMPLGKISAHFGLAKNAAYKALGVRDPGAAHLGNFLARTGETPEQRAFRRFPINSHKPA